MKTAHFLKALEQFGWYISREGGKHVCLSNRYFTPPRPLTLSFSKRSRLEPDLVENTAKNAGLVWKDLHPEPFPNPKHPYFALYQRAGLIQAEARAA